jgi:hypothetical protein
MNMDDATNPYVDSLSSGLSEAWGSLGDAFHKTGEIATDAYEVAHHTAAAMGDAFLGDTARTDHHMERRHAYERAIGDDYNGLRRILGLSVPEDGPAPSQTDSGDPSGDGGSGEDDGADTPGDASNTIDYYGGGDSDAGDDG